MAEPVYRRVVVKLSGEYFAGAHSFGMDQATIDRIAGDLIAAKQLGVEVAVVVGGGNMVRGVEVSSRGVSRPTGDPMGMLATVMNCLALEAGGRRTNIWPRVGSCCSAAEPAIRSSRPTRPRYCGRPKSAPKRC
jgi:uridylate kinase